MRRVPPSWLLLLAAASAACGHKIGDSCTISSDCAQDGTRVCDTFSPGGSCTIQGCDYGTCPDEAVCVRFFPALENAQACAGNAECAIDEVCTVNMQCAPRSIELRFCMLTCDGDSDCREGYECRNLDLMKRHGGEPVPDPNSSDGKPPVIPFCASRRPCLFQSDCDQGEVCDSENRVCRPA